MRVGVAQLPVAESKARNLAQARQAVEHLAQSGARLILLPEMFNCPYETKRFSEYAEQYPGGETLAMLSELAGSLGVTLVGGTIPEFYEGKLYNTSFVWGPQGELLGSYRKMHLFDISITGGVSFRESEVLSAGEDLLVFDCEGWRVGVMICYDLRFPELSRVLALSGAEILCIPAAFNTTTGPAHWEVSLRARAIDNQVYLMAASPARGQTSTYQAWGHSLVCDPWGRVLTQAGEAEEALVADLHRERLEQVRRELPLLQHRRRDLYTLKGWGRGD